MTVRFTSYPAATPAHNQLTHASAQIGSHMRRLSSGLRIESAADDAAGLAISERLRAKIRSFDQARRNAADGISMLQVTEGALGSVQDLLIRMRELALQASNGTAGAIDRKAINTEYQSLIDEITRIAEATEFNGISLLDGSTRSVQLQVGTGIDATVDAITVDNGEALTKVLAISNSRVTNEKTADKAIKRVDRAMQLVSTMRGQFGSVQNRLASTISNLSTQFEASAAAESRIRDIDIAKETAELTRSRILQSAAIAMLAQGNAQPVELLRLLFPQPVRT